MQPLQILIAENQDAVRRWVRSALEQQGDWTVCAEARTALEAIEKTVEFRPDVVLVDEELPGAGGLDITQEIARLVPAVHVLTLTSFVSGHTRAHDERGPAETVMGHTLVKAVKTLVAKEVFETDHAPLKQRRARSPRVNAEDSTAVLTSRELEVLRYLAGGQSNKEIGAMLQISARTVETHRARLMRKLDLHSMNQLVRYAIRQRIINV